uniref:Uncharacterized protein n=1 Tax=Panagrolaimus superbus TaxID=310955 RepID=A0A914YBB4_9BILA
MVASSKIVKADHLSIELSTNAKNGLLDAAKKISATAKCSKTITTKDIHGVKNLSFSQTYITDSKGNQTVAMSYDYVCDLNDDFELKITGRYSNGKVTVPVMITHKKQKWSLGCEIVLTLNPLELLKNVSLNQAELV